MTQPMQMFRHAISQLERRHFFRSDIETVIPHLFPFLFLEEVQVVGEHKLLGYASWADDHPIVLAHFPDKPVVPGVCQIEAIAQLAGVGAALWFDQINSSGQLLTAVLGAVRSCTFHSAVLPCQRLEISAEIRALSSQSLQVKALGRVCDQIVCRAELIVLLVPRVFAGQGV